MKVKVIFSFIILVLCGFHFNSASQEIDNSSLKTNSHNVASQHMEQGRTLVHHAVKRFMIILPAIFFKLGIAFTLLILVALVAVNNGFIGFLLLVVGLSSVLARLQEARRPPLTVPYVNPLPHYHHNVWDRSDAATNLRNEVPKHGYIGHNLQYNPGLTTYYTTTKL